MTGSLDDSVRSEIVSLHEFFVGWFSGVIEQSDFEAGFLSRFDPEFLLVPPAGSLLSLADLAGAVRAAHATNPEFRIAIRNVRVRREWDGHVLATYEEWQRNALASKPPDNARIATVLFKTDKPLRWLHIHETWMPEATGPFDF